MSDNTRKRKTFKAVFAGKCALVLAILAIIYIGILINFANMVKEETESNFHIASQSLAQSAAEVTNYDLTSYINSMTFKMAVRSETTDYDLTSYINSMMFKMAVRSETVNVASCLYETATKDMVIYPKSSIFLIKRKTDTTPVTFYIYPTAKLDGWDEFYKELNQYQSPFYSLTYAMEMPYFYINGDSIIPGEITLTGEKMLYTGNDLSDEDVALPVSRTIPGPATIPDGYEKVLSNDDYFLPIVTGYNPNYLFVKTSCEPESHQFLMETYNSIKENDTTTGILTAEDGLFHIKLSGSYYVTGPDNRQYTLLTAIHWNLWDTYGSVVVFTIILTLALGIIIALLISTISYSGLKTRYQQKDYQKNLITGLSDNLKEPLDNITANAKELVRDADNNAPNTARDNSHTVKNILKEADNMNQIIDSSISNSKKQN